jgi:hypothetical protein
MIAKRFTKLLGEGARSEQLGHIPLSPPCGTPSQKFFWLGEGGRTLAGVDPLDPDPLTQN